MNVSELFTPSPLLEAMRIPSDAKKVVTSNPKEFLIGIEYEFHVNGDVSGGLDRSDLRDIYGDQAREEAERKMDEMFLDDLDGIAELGAAVFAYVNDENDFLNFLGDDPDMEDAVASLPGILMELYNNETDVALSIQNVFAMNMFDDVEDGFVTVMNTVMDNRPEDAESGEEDEQITERVIAYYQNNRQAALAMAKFIDVMGDYGALGSASNVLDKMKEQIKRHSSTYEEMIEEHENDALDSFADDDMMQNTSSAIDFVRNRIEEDNMYMNVEDVVLDSSVKGGVEVVTKPLPFQRSMSFMRYMFELIGEIGSTSNSTGMHVNISHKSFASGMSLDPLKVMALMDVEFFQNLSSRKLIKYDQRNHMVANMMRSLTDRDVLSSIASFYIADGISGLETRMKDAVFNMNKFSAINWEHFFFGFDPGTRRIEFRFFGGDGYEDRQAEIEKDIIYTMYVIKSVAEDNYTPKDYYRGLMRILDRASNRTLKMPFSSVVNMYRKGTLDDFEPG